MEWLQNLLKVPRHSLLFMYDDGAKAVLDGFKRGLQKGGNTYEQAHQKETPN